MVTDLQASVATAADVAEAHATAPALLLQLQTALGGMAASATEATENGRRPFRVPHDWDIQLGKFGYLAYLLADQTGINLEAAIRDAGQRVTADGNARRAMQTAERTDWT